MLLIRKYNISFLILMTAVLLTSFQKKEANELQLTHLRTETLTDPEDIDIFQPRLNWEISGKQRNIQQTACQVLVASTPDGKLDTNAGQKFSWHITVPGNTKALVYIPTSSEKAVTEGGKKTADAIGLPFFAWKQAGLYLK